MKRFFAVVPGLVVGIVAAALLARAPAPATRPEAPAARPPARATVANRFMRFTDDGRGGGKVETAILAYRNADGVTVRLVGAVHVGEKAYYQGLAKTFAGYDALLYEMVKPKGMPAPRPGFKSGSDVTALQRWLKDNLELEFQLDAIDYGAANFVHADLDAETFVKMQADRGESILGLMVQAMLNQMANEMNQDLDGGGPGGNAAPPPSLLELLAAMASPDHARQIKLLLARQFNDIEATLAGLTGPDGSVLVTERNKAALAALKQAIASGKKNIGIFYGAAHMQDMEDRLKAMGFQPAGPPEWRVAWDLVDKNPTTGPVETPLQRLMRVAAETAATQPAATQPAGGR